MITEKKKIDVATDMEHFKMEEMFIQETHIKGSGVMDIRSNSGKEFTLYYNGVEENSNGGGTKSVGDVGIMVKEGYKVNFKEITDRICMITTEVNGRKYVLINAYVHTLPNSEKYPE